MKRLVKGLVVSFVFAGFFALPCNPLHVQAKELSQSAHVSKTGFSPQAIVINRPMTVGQEDQYVGITNVSYSGSSITVRIAGNRVYVKAIRRGKAVFSYRNTLGELVINNITVR
ncbi:hypothetical protein PJ311_05960 [Bacillus sp. CLL-7-23]|uniref:Uncharacterized protein n=1 Tax=Bacillus changyiensis TaxID=3004103 RepID=A0ABT4X1J8_9BACI|nr:hypothetical protein [Bacillus changyiensis]MDA7026158.1 hypothetical protein [Bacillus changyiensis]